jgi:uncharacterized protein (DUF169 family)
MSIQTSVLQQLSPLGLGREPVAVAFLSAPPPGLQPIGRAEGASCGYWRYASEGHAFYTTPDHHQNCPIGAFTHGVTPAPDKAHELQSIVGMMIELKYLRAEEVSGIPHRTEPAHVVAYAPLGGMTFEPDVVIFRGTPRQIMLLSEAARTAGIFDGSTMGRPACAMIPHAIGAAAGVASVGCIGNRVYTGLDDNELYFTVPGALLGRLLEKLGEILAANAELEAFHRQRAAAVSASATGSTPA